VSENPSAAAPSGIPEMRIELLNVSDLAAGTTVRWLGNWQGLILHYFKDGSVPCRQGVVCRECERRRPVQWRGYAPVLEWHVDGNLRIWRHAILEVTERLGEQLDGQDLRGREDCLRRVKARGKAKAVQAELLRRHAPGSLPDGANVQLWAEGFFRWPALIMGAKDPRPRAQYLPPVQAAASAEPPPPLPAAAPPSLPDASPEPCPTRVDAAMGRPAVLSIKEILADAMRVRPNGQH
jgi:hypothetical protein